MAVSDAVDETIIQQEIINVYECKCCLTRYDERYGDPQNDIEKGTPFDTLTDYCCPVCEAPVVEFSLIEA
ncbi:rubredoxin [Mucilaginibacter antarcticus]|uniref:rubredoxin n=1 Tax=Mucilaginibacter antarcticus TaxID=1855725 RepID=UPI00363C4F8A